MANIDQLTKDTVYSDSLVQYQENILKELVQIRQKTAEAIKTALAGGAVTVV